MPGFSTVIASTASLAELAQVARDGACVLGELCDAAQGARSGAFGEQGAQGAGTAQLHRQPALDLGVSGEQRGGGRGFAEQFDAAAAG